MSLAHDAESPDSALESDVAELPRRPRAASAGPDDVSIGPGIGAAEPARVGGAEGAERLQLAAAVLEASPDFVGLAGVDGRTLYVNEAGRRLVGLADEREARGVPLVELVALEDRSLVRDRVLPTVRDGARWDGLVSLQHLASGQTIPVRLAVFPTRDTRGGAITALAAISRSEVEHEVAQALRREMDAAQRLLVEAGERLSAASLDERATLHVAAQLAVPMLADWCFVDLQEDDGTLQRVAVAHADPAADALARSMERSAAARTDAPHGVARVLRTGATETVAEIGDEQRAGLARDERQLEALRAIGLRSYASVPLAARGRTLGVITFASTSATRRFGPREVAVCEELARRAALALDNASLLRQAAAARAEAEAANEAKSQFLATMSHEIRTPINAIQGYAQLIELGLAGPVTEPQRDYIGRLNASAQHLLGLVDDVLDLAKVDSGALRVSRDVVLAGPAIVATLDLTRSQAAARGVRLVEPPTPQALVPYVGDEHRVRQILLNLLSNAVKFSPRGGTVTVHCGVADAPPNARLQGGPWAFIAVSDDGVGIASLDVGRVFEPFHQGEQGHTRTKGGTGLGLAVSRRLARLMGGDVTVESVLGRGSTFTLWLPTLGAGAAPRVNADADDLGLGGNGSRVRGLAEIGLLLRERLDEIMDTLGARLRADPELPFVTELRRTELENHHLAFVSDAVQTLVVLEDAEDRDAELLRDASTIQRVCAELHGRLRQKQGWSLGALKREYTVIGETLDDMARRVAGERPARERARELLGGLVTRACEASGRALRHAADQAERQRG